MLWKVLVKDLGEKSFVKEFVKSIGLRFGGKVLIIDLIVDNVFREFVKIIHLRLGGSQIL